MIAAFAMLAWVLLFVAGCGGSDDSVDATPTTSSTMGGPTTTLSGTTTTLRDPTTTMGEPTTTLTSITVTTTSSSTSTLFPPCATGGSTVIEMEVVFSVTNAETIGALQFDTVYSTNVDARGSGNTVQCVRLAGDFAAFNDIESTRTIRTAIVSVAGISGPIDVASCTFRPTLCDGAPGLDDFAITITDQSRPDFSPANATVEVTDLGILYPTTTTTTSIP